MHTTGLAGGFVVCFSLTKPPAELVGREENFSERNLLRKEELGLATGKKAKEVYHLWQEYYSE